jgi:hypothetical protein
MAILTPALSPPTSHKITHFGSSSTDTHIVTEEPGPSRTSGLYPSVNTALTLAEQLDVHPTIQTMKTLEERTGDFDTLVRANCQYEDYDLEESDIDMLRPVKRHTSSVLTYDGHADCESNSEQVTSPLTVLSFADDFSEIGLTNQENRAPTPPYVDPHTVNCGDLQQELMDVVGLTLGLSLDDTERYPLQDLPVPPSTPPRITASMRKNGTTLLSKTVVTLKDSEIEPGMTWDEVQAHQHQVTMSKDHLYIHPNEVERYMENHPNCHITSKQAWTECRELCHKYFKEKDCLAAMAPPTDLLIELTRSAYKELDRGCDGSPLTCIGVLQASGSPCL